MVKYIDLKRKKVSVKKLIIYSILAVLSLLAGIYTPSLYKQANTSFLKTSMFEILDTALVNANKIIDDAITTESDLLLSKVVVRAIPDGYECLVKVKNEGPFVKDLKVMLANDISKDYIILKNSETGLTLSPDEEIVIRDYGFQMDKSYSGADINFYIKILNDDVFESKTENNFYKLHLDEYRNTVDDFYISQFTDDGMVFDYKLNDFLMNEVSFEILVSNKLNYDKNEELYREAYYEDEIFPYVEIPLNEDTYKTGNFKQIIPQSLPVKIDVFGSIDDENSNDEFYFLLKLYFSGENSKRYKLSNIIKVSPNKSVDKSTLSEILLETTGNAADLSSFSDDYLLRGETLKFLFEYFEIDISSLQSKKIFFKDLKPGNHYYEFAQALMKFDLSKGFSDYFLSDEKMNKQLLLKLVDEFKNY